MREGGDSPVPSNGDGQLRLANVDRKSLKSTPVVALAGPEQRPIIRRVRCSHSAPDHAIRCRGAVNKRFGGGQ